MNKKIPFLLLICMNIILIGFIFYFKILNLKLTSENNKILYYENQIEVAKKLFYYKLVEENVKLDSSLILRDTKKDTFQLKQLINNNNSSLFIFIPSMGCHSCLQNIIKDLTNFKELNLLDNFKFITSFTDNKKVKDIENEFSINIYNIDDKYLGFLAEREDYYFSFKLNRDMTTSQFYIFDGDLEKFTSQYLRQIQSGLVR